MSEDRHATLDIDHLRQWVGREQTLEQVLAPFPAQALAALLDHGTLPAADAALPLPWQWLYFLETPRRSTVGADGHPARGGFLPPVPLPRRMWASGEMTQHQALQLGVAACKRSVVRAVECKRGRSGTLVFVDVEHRFEQQGVLCLSERQHIVYRDAPVGPVALPPGEPTPDMTATAWAFETVPDEALLFRFSALTYNGHRIHYDSPYAATVEGYPALVVHGPLLAVWLLDALGRAHPASRVVAYRFRALRPAFVGRPLWLCGRLDGPQATLWTRDADGAVGMQAEVTLA